MPVFDGYTRMVCPAGIVVKVAVGEHPKDYRDSGLAVYVVALKPFRRRAEAVHFRD